MMANQITGSNAGRSASVSNSDVTDRSRQSVPLLDDQA